MRTVRNPVRGSASPRDINERKLHCPLLADGFLLSDAARTEEFGPLRVRRNEADPLSVPLERYHGRDWTPHERAGHYLRQRLTQVGIREVAPDLEYPVAEVMVLAPERTFWEKATLVHVECNRQREGWGDRLSRHWYDLVMLGQSKIGPEAISNRALLEDVVRFRGHHTDLCLTFRLFRRRALPWHGLRALSPPAFRTT